MSNILTPFRAIKCPSFVIVKKYSKIDGSSFGPYVSVLWDRTASNQYELAEPSIYPSHNHDDTIKLLNYPKGKPSHDFIK